MIYVLAANWVTATVDQRSTMADFNVKALEANLKIALIGDKISQAARARKRLA